MPAPLQIFSISTAFSTLLFAIIYMFLARDSKQRYMALWALAMLFFGLIYFADYFLAGFAQSSYTLARLMVLIACANLFLAGACDFFGARFPRIAMFGIIGSAALAALSLVSESGYDYFSIPLMLCSTFVFVCSGLMFMLYSWTPHVTEKYIASFIIIVLGIYNINLPFHSGYPAVVPVNYTIGLILQSTLGILLLIIHFKKGRFSLARQEAHYRLLVENAAGIILLYIYTEMKFRYVSPSIRDEMGVSEDSLGHNAFSLLEGIEGDGTARMRGLLETPPEGAVNFIFSKRFSEMQSKWFEIYATPVYDDTATPVGIECIISNITARMDMLDSLKRTEQSRKELVEDISHELRTPLTIIQGYTETLLKDITDDATRVYLEIIDAKARTLNTLLEDLIQTSLFSSRRVEYKFYEAGARKYLEQLANEIRIRVESERRCFRHDSNIPADTLMVIDKSRIDQVVSNIVGNALESTSPGDSIEFISHADAAASESGTDGRVLICVRDSGRGIPEGELGNIFRRRYSGLAHTDGEGHGLGLYISREIVEQHGGQIWAENNKGNGASLCFYLPCYTGGAS